MNPKTTNLLLILLLIVGAYFLVFERQAPTTIEREQSNPEPRLEEGRAVFTADQLPTESVVSVSIRRGDKTINLVKQGEDWFQVEPVRFKLNGWSVRQLIDEAAGLNYFQRFDPAAAGDSELPTMDQVSLSSPEAIVILEVQQASDPDQTVTQEIALGRQAVVGGRAYAMINDDGHVYVVDDALHRQIIDQDETNWRMRSIDAPTEGQAQRVVLERQGQEAVAVRKDNGSWSFDAPHSGRADSQAISGLLAAVGDAHIEKFVADNPDDKSVYGLDQPVTVLSVELPAVGAPKTPSATTAPAQATTASAGDEGDSKRSVVKTLRVGAATDLKNEQYFATWTNDVQPGPVVFTVLASVLEKFTKSVDDLRDARITPLAVADVRELIIERPEARTLRFVRGTDGWAFGEPGPGYEADGALVSSLVESMIAAKATAFEPLVQPSADPVATITLTAIGRSEPDVLRIFPRGEAGTYPVVRNSETILYHVPEIHLQEILAPSLTLRQRTVLNLNGDNLTRVTIEHQGGPTYLFERSDPQPSGLTAATTPHPQTSPAGQAATGLWRLVGHHRFESEALGRLLLALSPLETEGWVVASPSGQPAAVNPTLSVNLEVAGGQQHTLIVDPDRFQGRIDGQGQWFKLNRELVELLSSEFRMRTVIPVDIDQIDNVQVVRGEKSVSIRNDAEANRYVAQESVEIDQSVAGGLFDTLSGLRVERFTKPQHVSLPPLKIVITTVDGRVFRLAFAQPKDPEAVVTNGDLWFTVDAKTLDKLNGEVVKPGDGVALPTGRP